MYSPQNIQVTLRDGPATIHLVSPGSVAVKTRFRQARRTGWPATVDFMLDRNFTEWMPIWVMIIQHPEGVFVIDTGEIAAVNEPGYFRSSGFFTSWFDTTQFRFRVSREEEIDRQLAALNIPADQVKAVILTHLHFDHTDGLKYFPHTPVLVNRAEWEKPFGDLPKLYPSWFQPTLISLDRSYDVFEKVQYLTSAEDLLLVHTPGHTFGHCSVLLRTDRGILFFAADICYTQEQLLLGKFSANSASHALSRETYARVKTFAQTEPLVFLPAHDPGAGERLKTFATLF